ncbi:MAG TPA: hypothetical protein VE196_07530, partial [Pseudonocardiaceae bacterium]|nr:hypothetical protein [Pseudonocardiaceae bacterium]
PMCAWVYTLAAAVLATGRPAGPVAVFDHAREHLDTTARTVHTGGAERLARLGVWLLDTYRDTPHTSPEHAEWLKTVVLKQAWRRAVTAHATRVLQAAEQCSTTELRRIHTDTAHTEHLWHRYHTATHTRTGGDSITRRAA